MIFVTCKERQGIWLRSDYIIIQAIICHIPSVPSRKQRKEMESKFYKKQTNYICPVLCRMNSTQQYFKLYLSIKRQTLAYTHFPKKINFVFVSSKYLTFKLLLCNYIYAHASLFLQQRIHRGIPLSPMFPWFQVVNEIIS
jgi:hypothetical protein